MREAPGISEGSKGQRGEWVENSAKLRLKSL